MSTINVDNINEYTTGDGVTIDGLKYAGIQVRKSEDNQKRMF